MPDIELYEAIYSARSPRHLKPDPVPEELITRVLDAAMRAPSGGNARYWAFVVVRDPDRRRRLQRDLAQGLRQRRGRLRAVPYRARDRV